jgi:hypothetical protein
MNNEEIAQDILDELFSSLEAVETQTAAILQFLNDKGLAEREELAPYLKRASEASSIRWRAARARIERLVSSAMKSAEEGSKKEPPKSREGDQGKEPGPEKKTSPESGNAGQQESRTKDAKQNEQETKTTEKPAPAGKPEPGNANASANQGSEGSHDKGNEGDRISANANKSGTDTNEKAA